MSERFFIDRPIQGDTAELIGDEARHLKSVMRAEVGDRVLLFDGSGVEFAAFITAIAKHNIQLVISERREVSRELPFSLTLAVALPKGDRQKWLVEKVTELGVTRLIPIITERGVAQPVESALERLRRGVLEASKQCGRNRLLEIAEPQDATDLFASPATTAVRLIAHPTGRLLAEILSSPFSSDITVAIGPEGGFTDAEVAAALSNGWQPAALGSRILRVETAAIAIAAWASCQEGTNQV